MSGGTQPNYLDYFTIMELINMKPNLIHIIIPIGNASCGKSTYFTKLQEHYGNKYPTFRISADEIRFKLLDYDHTGKDYDEKIEPQVWEMVYETFENILNHEPSKVPIIIYFDCTNLTVKERSQIIIRSLRSFTTEEFHDKQLNRIYMQSKPNIIQIHMVVFDIPLSVSLIWNKNRKRNVPEKVIAQQFIRYEKPLPYEFDTVTVIQYDPKSNGLIWGFPKI
jgi:predicted kinase